MRRRGDLFPRVVRWPTLVRAAHSAAHRKRWRPNVLAFHARLEENLLELQRELETGAYAPGPFRSFEIFEPKRRLISAAPYRDRIVHHAVCAVLEPLFEPTFIDDSHACRRGHGVHRAVARAEQFQARFEWVLKGDVAAFFPSIDHGVLLGLLGRKLKCPRLLRLLTQIVSQPYPGQRPGPSFAGDTLWTRFERPCGLPLGNQTSQFFGNVMLNPLDHFVKEQLRCRGYLRYADDFLLFGESAGQLGAWRGAIRKFLRGLRLRLNEHKTVVFPVNQGIPFLGFKLFWSHRRLSRGNLRRFQRRLARWRERVAAGRMTQAEVSERVRAWWGHAQHADCWRIASQILDRSPFQSPEPFQKPGGDSLSSDEWPS